MNPSTIIIIVLLVTAVILEIVLLFKGQSGGSGVDERTIRNELDRYRSEAADLAGRQRIELQKSLETYQDGVLKRIGEATTGQKEQLDIFTKQLSTLTEGNTERMEKMRETIETRLKELQENNDKRLEKMQHIVDEKLQETLNKRIGESFKIVQDNLERVQKGLGEMQKLASDVGGLKRVLENVKTRGTWGEIQLGALLDEVLLPGQYAVNVATRKNSPNRVEFAIKLPGREEGKEVYLPIDSKFPMNHYNELLDAYDGADPDLIAQKKKALFNAAKKSAKDICDKYIGPPETTDFAIMFLPVEGLYAEIMRDPDLFQELQTKFKVLPCGPTILAALLNSLQLGFRTLAIQKRSSEVWELLSVIKREFGKFGEMLDKAKKSIHAAGNHLETLSGKTRRIESKLKNVQELPEESLPKLPDKTTT